MSAIYGKQEIYSLLETRGIAFERLEHEAVYTMEDMDRAGITAKGGVCKNLFLRDAKGKKHFLVTVPEEKRIDLKILAERIGSTKLSFASADRLAQYLGVEQGCVSPFGVFNDENGSVIVVFDQDLQFHDAVGIHPNDNTSSVWLNFSTLQQMIEEHGNKVMLIKFD